MAQPLAAPYSYFADSSGAPLAGGKIYTYAAGTVTPKDSYTDSGAGTPLTNPVILDSAGRAVIFLSGSYKIVVADSLDNIIRTVDNIQSLSLTSTEMGYLHGVTPGTASASQVVILDSNENVSGLATNAFDTAATSIANMTAVQGSSYGFKNKFRNPVMDIAQHGRSGSVTTGNANYSVDGWIIGATGATATWVQTYGSVGSIGANFLQIIGNTSMTDTFVKQRIESTIAASLAGKQVTIQLFLNNITGGTLTPTITVKHATLQDNWGATVIDVNAQSLQAIANNGSGTLAYTFTASTGSVNGLEISIDFGAALNSNSNKVLLTYFDIRPTPGVAGGQNNNPPIPEMRPIPMERAFCQSYFCSTFGDGVTPAQSAGLSGALGAQDYGTTAGEVYTQWNFPVQMRSSPTIVTFNPSASNANWRDVTGSSDVVVSVDPDSAKGVAGVMITAQTTALTAGHRLYIHATANAEL